MLENKIKKFQGSEVELEYLLTGESNNEVIMFVHGAGTNLRQFFPQHEYFSMDYQVLSVSLRGHGKSSNPAKLTSSEFSLKKHRDDLLELLQFLSVETVHYVGNSAGGMIGYELVKEQPSLLSSFVTFGTTAELTYPLFFSKAIVGINRWMFKLAPGAHCKFLARNSSKIKSVQEEIANQFMLSKDSVSLFQHHLGNYSYLDVLEKLEIPFLLVQGEEDKDINMNLKSTIHAIESNTNATIRKIAKAGHFANLESPTEFNKMIENFLITNTQKY